MEQHSPHARRVGVTVMVLLIALVAYLQFARGRSNSDQALDFAFAQLAQAELIGGSVRGEHIAAAHKSFAKAVAVVSLEPQALIGVAVTEQLAGKWGQGLALPKELTQCTDDELTIHLRGLLERGNVRAAEGFLHHPFVVQRQGGLRELVVFVQRWRSAQSVVARSGVR